jgi:P pilus assembly chaperone PapD
VRYYLTLLVLYICNTLVYGQGISISPSRIFFTGEPGQTVSQVITFSNTSNAELNFVANLKDWDRDSIGVKKYYSPGQKQQSNAAWLTLSENTVRLAPGETKSVNLSMTIPKNPAPQQLSNAMLFFYTSERTKSRTPKWP